MDSGSGKNRDENRTKEPPGDDVPRPREESTAAAAAPEPPPPAPPSERLQERTNGSPEAGGGRNPSAPVAVAVAPSPRDGTAVVKPPLPPRAAPSRRGSASVKTPHPPHAASVSRAGEPKPAGGKPLLPRRAVPAASTSKSKGKKPMSHAEVVESSMAVRAKCKQMRDGRREIEEAFNVLLKESKKAMPEQGTATQQKKQVSEWREMREGRREMEEELNELLEESKKAMPEQGTATQQKEQTISMTKPHGTVKQQKEKRESRKMNHKWSRLFVILLLLCCLPTVTAFQRFKTLDKAADHLGRHSYLQQMQARLVAEEAHGRHILRWTVGAIAAAAFLLGEFVVGAGQEAETNMAGMTLVTGNAERCRVPRPGNAVPGTGTRERSRSGPVKVHQKRRFSFLDPVPRPLRSGNTVTKGMTASVVLAVVIIILIVILRFVVRRA
ncbi:unnamed protein product [Urochloa decumbens]|uniref:Uncharacterized protein n=1 Tax=Urochloa decumbens TaxID=240449 RepID=A0ABC8VBK4_9POAL